MSDDTISRQAAIDALKRAEALTKAFGYHNVIDTVMELPSAERRGRWEFNIDDEGWSWDKPYMCDQCGEWVEKEFNFCPNCGTRMEATK